MSAQYQCNNCGRSYVCPPRGRVGLFCSARCRRAYWRRRVGGKLEVVGAAEDQVASLEWDGQSQYSVGVLVHTYRAYCVCCGADAWYALSHAEVRALPHLPTCQICGGTRWIEEDVSHEWNPSYLGAEQTGDDLERPRPARFDSQLNWWKRPVFRKRRR